MWILRIFRSQPFPLIVNRRGGKDWYSLLLLYGAYWTHYLYIHAFPFKTKFHWIDTFRINKKEWSTKKYYYKVLWLVEKAKFNKLFIDSWDHEITRAQSPASHIKTAESWFNWLANSGWSFRYSLLTNDAAPSAWLESTSARQQPLKPAPLNRAPNTPGALKRISYSWISGSEPKKSRTIRDSQSSTIILIHNKIHYLMEYTMVMEQEDTMK